MVLKKTPHYITTEWLKQNHCVTKMCFE
jgi:hypothetical protein